MECRAGRPADGPFTVGRVLTSTCASWCTFLCGSASGFGLLHALCLTLPSFCVYLRVFGYSRSRRSARERKCEQGLLLTDQKNRIKLSFVAPPQGCQSTVQHAQLVP